MGKNSYTKISNIIFDKYMHAMSSSAFKVVMCVARKTVGWNKEQDTISLSQFELTTGLSRKTLISAIKESVANGWICQCAFKNTFSYSLGCAFKEDSLEESQEDFCTEGGTRNGGEKKANGGDFASKPVDKFHTQKTVTKETNTKDNRVVFSDSGEKQKPEKTPHLRASPATSKSSAYGKAEAEIARLLGQQAVLFWRSVYARFIIAKLISENKITMDAVIYSIAYALEKGENPGIVFNMVKSAPKALPSWSSAIDIETGKPEWKRFIWNAFGDKPDTKFVDEAPFVF
jgi:phage replication O-like protein O